MSGERHQLLELVLRLALRAERREEFLGDLLEEASSRRLSGAAARRWLWRQTLRSLPSLAAARIRRALFRPVPLAATATAGPSGGPGAGATFAAFLGAGARVKRRPFTVALSVLVHAGVLVTAVLWGAWRADEVQPPALVPVIIWNPARMPAANLAGGNPSPAREPERRQRPPRRPPTVAAVAPVTVAAQPPAAGPGAIDPSQHAGGGRGCPPGQECGQDHGDVAGDPPPALPPRIAEKACLSCPPPQLPPAYKRAGVSLQALLKICVDAQGGVRSVQVLRGISAAVDADIVATIKRWRYTPHAINGRPVPFCYAANFVFQVQ